MGDRHKQAAVVGTRNECFVLLQTLFHRSLIDTVPNIAATSNVRLADLAND